MRSWQLDVIGDSNRFSALQRAEIAEISGALTTLLLNDPSFSALQRAEIAEIFERRLRIVPRLERRFSALQRAEIAEMTRLAETLLYTVNVSVLFNEPKLLKSVLIHEHEWTTVEVSVLFNEPKLLKFRSFPTSSSNTRRFQCSSTSRNC